MARQGVVFAEGFLSAEDAGARIAEAFLAGREDLPERTIMEIEHGKRPLPMFVGGDPVGVRTQFDRYWAIVTRTDAITDDRRRLAAQLGRALDVDAGLRREFAEWSADLRGTLATDLVALGPEVGRRLAAASPVIIDLREGDLPFTNGPDI